MTGKTWAYEDFVEGASLDIGSKDVSAAEIIEFASEFDAQPMHLDEEAGKASILGGLSASGWHTCAMFMRMLIKPSWGRDLDWRLDRTVTLPRRVSPARTGFFHFTCSMPGDP